uniref:Profilin n=1 Tax=Denticeps clupeoides TaxID=299321 RepID=A0AAY4BPY5_9TELE
MAWQQYVTNLMSGDFVLDAAILGHEAGAESVWASNPGGTFGRITPAEIKALVANDRSAMFAGGVTLGGQKCTVLRDALNVDQQHTMDIRTKATDADPDTYSICIAKTNKGTYTLTTGASPSRTLLTVPPRLSLSSSSGKRKERHARREAQLQSLRDGRLPQESQLLDAPSDDSAHWAAPPGSGPLCPLAGGMTGAPDRRDWPGSSHFLFYFIVFFFFFF